MGVRDWKEYHRMAEACRSAPGDPNMFSADRTADLMSLVGSLRRLSEEEEQCGWVFAVVKLRSEDDEGCVQERPGQTEEEFASHGVAAEVSVGSHDCRRVDSDLLASMEDRYLSVLATAPHMVLNQT